MRIARHSDAARTATEAIFDELIAVVVMANEISRLANRCRVPNASDVRRASVVSCE